MCQFSWFLDPGGWSKATVVGLYFIFPGLCTLSLHGFLQTCVCHTSIAVHMLPKTGVGRKEKGTFVKSSVMLLCDKLFQQRNGNGNLEYCTDSAYSSYSPLTGPLTMEDNRRIQMLADTVATLPRGRKQLALARSSSLGDFSWSQRKLVTVEKQDNGAFGFEIQTYRLQNQNICSSEVCTMIYKVQEDSPAHCAGLQAGDILANINGVSTEGFTHKQVVDLIRSSGNLLTIETLNGTMIHRRAELEAKLQALKQTLKKKWVEFRSLHLQEQRLLH
ncbi:hypothetical protein STEG23_003437, partial [Scotinomys teguina]